MAEVDQLFRLAPDLWLLADGIQALVDMMGDNKPAERCIAVCAKTGGVLKEMLSWQML